MANVTRLALVLLALLAFVPAATGGGSASVFGIEWRLGGGVTLLRLDATSLKPIPGLKADLGSATHVLTRSPDRRRVLAAGNNVLRVADLRTNRVSSRIYPGGWVSAALWTRADTIVVVTEDELVFVDSRRNSIARRIELRGHVLATARANQRLVLLLGPEEDIGQLSVATVDGGGTLRTKTIAMRGGAKTLLNEERNLVGMRSERPGLAVDASATHAVVAGLTTIVNVDLADLSSTIVAARTRRLQKTSEGWERGALWLDAHHVAVFGSDLHGERPATAAPFQIVDLRSGSADRLDTTASYAKKWNSLLVAVGTKVSVFEPDGTLRFDALEHRFAGQVIAGETFLYVETSGRGTTWLAIEPVGGRVVGRRTVRRPLNIVDGI